MIAKNGIDGVTAEIALILDVQSERIGPNVDLIDLGMGSDGGVDFLGRADYQVTLRGHRIELGDVETALESAVLRLMASAIETDVPDFGVDDDFFALGGDSVQATPQVAAVRDWLDAPSATAADVLRGRTAAGLAARLQAQNQPDRLEAVAAIYLEISDLSEEQIAELIAE